MKSPSPAARKAAPTKPTGRKAPAKKAAPSEADQIRSLLARSTPSEQRAILAVMERTNEVLAETTKIIQNLTEITSERAKIQTLKRGLHAMAKASGINLRSEEAQG